MSIMSVLGPIGAGSLGLVAPHEHVYIDMEVFFAPSDEIEAKAIGEQPVSMDLLGLLKRNPFAVRDNVVMTDPETQTAEMMRFRYAGGGTVVDATTVGLGRDPRLLRKMAVDTGLNIIAGAGFYVEDAQTEAVKQMSVGQLQEQIVRELNAGIGHTGVRAGIIGEIGVSWKMMPFERKSLTAACRAQKETGAPLMVHINPWSTCGLDALDIVSAEGVDPSRVVICHVDVEDRRDYIDKLLDSGAYIEFDNFGKEMFTDRWDCKEGSGRFVTDWERVVLLGDLLSKGYEKQILLSCDVCLKSLLHAYGGWGYDHVLTHIVPMLEEVGATPAQIGRMLRENPKDWLCPGAAR